eukprot:TRINITY_DN2058_c0_g1_i2.p1 TRINITY_DN2058_c0_g1~~TRINITY_DN2058_c0_g1_i2.p1  ORF type:complete len:145 (+),score=37.51 TRINITY_DN2058_c0_g1_i2:113-547(+)
MKFIAFLAVSALLIAVSLSQGTITPEGVCPVLDGKNGQRLGETFLCQSDEVNSQCYFPCFTRDNFYGCGLVDCGMYPNGPYSTYPTLCNPVTCVNNVGSCRTICEALGVQHNMTVYPSVYCYCIPGGIDCESTSGACTCCGYPK